MKNRTNKRCKLSILAAEVQVGDLMLWSGWGYCEVLSASTSDDRVRYLVKRKDGTTHVTFAPKDAPSSVKR